METDAYDDDVPACSSCEDAQKDYAHLEMVAKNLAAIVRRLAHELRGVSTDHDLPGKALDYLKREGFAGQPIRKVGAGSTARPPTPTGWSDTDWLKHLQEQQHPLAGMHINQGSMDAAADAYEAEYNEAHGIGETAKPVAWIRFCSDGCYEGPIMDEQIEDVRKKSGAWTPLYVRHNYTGEKPT